METGSSIAEAIIITVESPLRYPDCEWDSLAARLSSRIGCPVFSLHSHYLPDRSDHELSQLWKVLEEQDCERLVWISIGSSARWWESIRDGVLWHREEAKRSCSSEGIELYIAPPLDARDWCEFLVESSKSGDEVAWLFLVSPPSPVDPIGEDRPDEANQEMRAKRSEVAELVWEFRRRNLNADFAFQIEASSVQRIAIPLPRIEIPWGSAWSDLDDAMGDAETQIVRCERDATYKTGVGKALVLDAIDSILIGKWLSALKHGRCVWRNGGRDRDTAYESFQYRIQQTLPSEYANSSEPVSPRSMGSAKLPSEEFGQVPWGEIWTSFCDLAIAGGPPHRGRLLEAVDRIQVERDLERYRLVVGEIRRGIEEAGQLKTLESDALGWVGIECEDETMAAWLLRAIIAENVIARREGRCLFVPAGPHFSVKREIKNVITAVAKTARYWRSR